MKIFDTNSVNKVSAKKVKKASMGGGNFGELIRAGDDVEDAPALSGVKPMSMLEGLLAIQQVEQDVVAIEQAKKKANEVIGYLDQIRHGLLSGKISTMDVHNLMHAVKAGQYNVADPRLRSILEEVETRAAVELAKLEMQEKSNPPETNPR